MRKKTSDSVPLLSAIARLPRQYFCIFMLHVLSEIGPSPDVHEMILSEQRR